MQSGQPSKGGRQALRGRYNECDELKSRKMGQKNRPNSWTRRYNTQKGKLEGGDSKRYMQGDTRATHRVVTYRLVDDGDSVTKVGDVGDHIANDGGIEQRTQKEVG
jgi:hypothetical protein